MRVLRAVFSNKDPLIAFHMLKTEIPYTTLLEYIEYLDVFEALKEYHLEEERKAAAKAQADNR